MLYYLDTNICITCIRKSIKTENIVRRFIEYGYFNIKLSTIVIAELMHGAYKSKRTEKTLSDTEEFIAGFEVIPFDYDAAVAYGKIKASLERKGQVIGSNDMLIAAVALSRNAVLVTNNTREFSRIDGLKLDDWTL